MVWRYDKPIKRVLSHETSFPFNGEMVNWNQHYTYSQCTDGARNMLIGLRYGMKYLRAHSTMRKYLCLIAHSLKTIWYNHTRQYISHTTCISPCPIAVSQVNIAPKLEWHYNDVIMSTMTSQITSLVIVYSTVYSGADERKHQSSASLAFVRGIHQWAVNSPHKGPVTRKMLPFDDVIMKHDQRVIHVDGPHSCLPMVMVICRCIKKSKSSPPPPPHQKVQTHVKLPEWYLCYEHNIGCMATCYIWFITSTKLSKVYQRFNSP